MAVQRTLGHFNRKAKFESIKLRRQQKQKELRDSLQEKKTPGFVHNLNEVTSHLYTDDEIRRFSMITAIENHPLRKKSTNVRSKLAYKEIMENVLVSPKYLLPGMFAVFGYREPKMKAELEYYDATPAVLFCGITRTKNSAIRELGFNLHYFPPIIRGKIIELVYKVFRQYYDKYFNEIPTRPNRFIDYYTLKKLLDKYKIGFGLRMYIPVLRGKTYIIPSRLIPTLSYTEGHFNGTTLGNIRRLWHKLGR